MKIVTPVSHLFKHHSSLIIENSDILELRDHDTLPNFHEDLYHSELNILAKWEKEEIDKLEGISTKHKSLIGVSFHIMSKYNNNKQMEIGIKPFEGIGNPMTRQEMMINVEKNCSMARKLFGKNIIILAENINHLLTDAYDEIVEPKFIKEVIENNGIFLLLDIAHAEITCINKNKDLVEYLKALPLDKCLQIHLSRLEIKHGKAYDAHNALEKKDWEMFKNILKLTKNARFVTLEYYRDIDILIIMLKKLRKEIQ